MKNTKMMYMAFGMIIGITVMVAAGASPKNPVKHEYKVIKAIVGTALERSINSYADIGWEVVSAGNEDRGRAFAILRRVKK